MMCLHHIARTNVPTLIYAAPAHRADGAESAHQAEAARVGGIKPTVQRTWHQAMTGIASMVLAPPFHRQLHPVVALHIHAMVPDVLIKQLMLLLLCESVFAAPVLDGLTLPLARVQRSTDDFKEIRERIARIAQNVTRYSGKVQNGVGKMDVEKNKLSDESVRAVVKQKELNNARQSLEKELSSTRNQVSSTNQQIQQSIAQIAKEAQAIQNAENEVNSIRRDRPKWHCVWRCRKKYKRRQKHRIEAAQVVVNAAKQRHTNALRTKGEQESKRNSLNHKVAEFEASLKRNQQEAEQCKQNLLRSTHLTETVLQLLKDLTSLKLNVDYLYGELKASEDLDNQDLGIGMESVSVPLDSISNYLNNGGFVKDLAGWGIDIKGFDVQSIRYLGIDIDEKTAKLLAMKS